MARQMAEPRLIFVISDATGETAEKVVRAALLQFTNVPVSVRMYTRVRLEAEMRSIIGRAKQVHALVVFTVVSTSHRELLRRLCDEENVDAVDLIGTLMAKLSSYLGAQPKGVPGLLHTLSDEYFRRVEAVEFTVRNDDGREPRNLPKADLVLVGISRTSKTPLSTFLAQKGLKVSNVPLVLGIEPPKELFEIDQEKIFGLTIKAEALLQIRQARLKHLGMPADTSYGQRDHISQEIAYAQSLFRKQPSWPVIDITGKAVEETAADILRIKKDRDNRRNEATPVKT
ncbi:MAG TPA: pyruvate, water dikinase regulatory protein [Polyangia bacterium]|nr:pyruvate, water dikinase regulatory protein [Polyangia bacterium]